MTLDSLLLTAYYQGMPPTNQTELLRALPAVQRVIADPRTREYETRFGKDAVLAAARESLAEIRTAIAAQKFETNGLSLEESVLQAVLDCVAACIERRCCRGVQRVINATGVILHTGLGRAVLPHAAINEIVQELSGYAAVEVDVESGKRGHRDEASRELLKTLLDCEHATVVNNNAAATLLALAAVARGKEVIVSRGQLVEIGGSFRVPDVMRESGCKLIEVGTTNRTRISDYENAITPETAALLIVHTSNFRLIGFTEEVSVSELAKLGRARNLPVIHDIGSGALLPDFAPELKDEPVAKSSLEDGADLVLFSADKILGGPQGGIVAGKTELVEKLRHHPLYRAFRCDKMKLRALETTLRLYLDPEKRAETIPTLRMLQRSLTSISEEAESLAKRIMSANKEIEATCADDSSRLGSGSLPERNIPTRVVSLRHKKMSADDLAAKLRAHKPPIFSRIQDDRVLFDPRTLLSGDADEIVRAASNL